MSIGQVTIVQVDNMQGDFSKVERLFLYVGRSAEETIRGQIIPVSVQSDLDDIFGEADSELKTQLEAAKNNSRNINWGAYAISINPDAAEDPDDWRDVVRVALDAPNDLNIETVALCTPVASKAEVEACYTFAMEILTTFAKFISIHAAVAGIDPETQSWAEYLAAVGALVDGVAAERVCLVPQLHGNNLGAGDGRLCDPGVTLADSPMRTATGPVIGLGDAPVDKDDAPLTMAIIKTLADARFCVPQWYTGYDGIYWADMMTLAAEGSDLDVYENLRVMDYLARRVRIRSINRVADRRLNSTAQSISANKTYFMRPLREASHPVILNGEEHPGMIKPPGDNGIDIQWPTKTSVKIAITARPYNCPKDITVYLGLDLSN